jgi:hypothetical protein
LQKVIKSANGFSVLSRQRCQNCFRVHHRPNLLSQFNLPKIQPIDL